jgi:hypothetical protein
MLCLLSQHFVMLFVIQFARCNLFLAAQFRRTDRLSDFFSLSHLCAFVKCFFRFFLKKFSNTSLSTAREDKIAAFLKRLRYYITILYSCQVLLYGF